MTNERIMFDLFRRVVREGAYAHLVLKNELPKSLTKEERAYITAWFYGAISAVRESDYIIDAYAKGRVSAKVQDVLRIGLYQLFYMRRPAHAVCNEMVLLTENIGKAPLKGFVNAVMRRAAREGKPAPPKAEDARLSLATGYPAFFVRELKKERPSDYKEFLSAPAPREVWRRNGVLPPQIFERCLFNQNLPFSRHEWLENAYYIEGDVFATDLYETGACTLQSASSMLACLALSPRPGESVLDACAAPGGKTLYLAEMAGAVLACDVHPHKLDLILAGAKRMGKGNIEVQQQDARQIEGQFDCILADVPCSGLGVAAGKPDIRLFLTEEKLAQLEVLQEEILSNLAKALKPGGRLVYSTCTVRAKENGEQVKRFLSNNPGCELLDFAGNLPKNLQKEGAGGMLSLWPHIHQTEGFFISCIMRKKEVK